MLSDMRSRVDISWVHIVLIFLRFVQFALALTVVGLYGVDLNRARKEKKYVDSKWVGFSFFFWSIGTNSCRRK